MLPVVLLLSSERGRSGGLQRLSLSTGGVREHDDLTGAKSNKKQLDNLSRLWRVLHVKHHALEEWLDQAQAALEDTEDDYDSLIRKHKAFFVRVDDRMLQEYLQACKDILVVLEEDDRPALTESMENIQQRWEVRTAKKSMCSPGSSVTYLISPPVPFFALWVFIFCETFFSPNILSCLKNAKSNLEQSHCLLCAINERSIILK